MAEEIWDHEILEMAKIVEWLKAAPGFDKNKGEMYVDTVTFHFEGEPAWVATETDGISWVFTRAPHEGAIKDLNDPDIVG